MFKRNGMFKPFYENYWEQSPGNAAVDQGIPVEDRAMAAKNGSIVRLHGLPESDINDQLGVILSSKVTLRIQPGMLPRSGTCSKEAKYQVQVTNRRAPVEVHESNLRFGRAMPRTLWLYLSIGTFASAMAVWSAWWFGPGTFFGGLPPLFSLLWCVFTVSMCYWMHWPLIASGVLVPAVSELAIDSDARTIYQIGFLMCAFTLCNTMWLLSPLTKSVNWFPAVTDLASFQLAQSRGVIDSQGVQVEAGNPGLFMGVCAAYGVAMQGLCTLHVDASRRYVSALHLGGGIAMWGWLQHVPLSNAFFKSLPSDSALRQGGLAEWGFWLRKDCSLEQFASDGRLLQLVLVGLFLVPFLLHLASKLFPGTRRLNVTDNLSGLLQLAIVASIAGYFATYTFDLAFAVRPSGGFQFGPAGSNGARWSAP